MSRDLLDVMDLAPIDHIDVDKGYVKLVDCLPRLVPKGRTADVAIVSAARVSTKAGDTGIKSIEEDDRLIRYLMRNRHSTPFEAVEFVFDFKLPILVARQLVRHRTVSLNEFSARYAEVPDEFWTPKEWRGQGKSNKQGGDEVIEYIPGDYRTLDDDDRKYSVQELAFKEYRDQIEAGVSREIARSCLPVSTYTVWRWKQDLRNLLHMISLRDDKHAQKETREFAHAVYLLISPIVPYAISAWEDYTKNAVTLTALEVKRLRALLHNARRRHNIVIPAATTGLDKMTDREIAEWEAKRQLLGMTDVMED